MPSVAQGTLFDWIAFHSFDDGPDGYNNALGLAVAVVTAHGLDINGLDEHGARAMCYAVAQHANEPTVATTLFAHGPVLEWHDEAGRILLDFAILAVQKSESVGCVGFLLDNNVPLNLRGSIELETTLMQRGCDEQSTEAVRALIEHVQANIAMRDAARHQWTLLHTACALDCVPVIQLLVQHELDSNESFGGFRPAFSMPHIWRATSKSTIIPQKPS